MTGDAARAAALALLACRAPDATICPSEVARALAEADGEAGEWRAAMPVVHEAVDAMLREEVIALSWKGRPLPERAGAYRIRRA